MLIWLGALIVGITMGLLGSGGSILSVPILVYLVGEGDKVAIAESLAIVGTIAVFAIVPYARKGLVSWRTIGLFGVPGMAGAYAGAALARFVPGALQLALFVIVMLGAAISMVRPGPISRSCSPRAFWKIALDGLLVGVLTGLVGVGGGFLIVPALVLFGGLPIREAVGTSLGIIALKSFAGYVKYLDVLDALQLEVNGPIIAVFAALGVLGSVIGSAVASRLPQALLRQVFASLLVVMGLFILAKNVPPLVRGAAPVQAAPIEN